MLSAELMHQQQEQQHPQVEHNNRPQHPQVEHNNLQQAAAVL
jgi:hypothetical protein